MQPLLILVGLIFLPLATRAADAAWTAFGAPVISASEKAGLRMQSNGAMGFERGLSTQALYVVDCAADDAVKTLRNMDPTRFPELEVFQQHAYHTEAEARFSDLRIDPKIPSFQRLLEEMRAPGSLQLAKEESARLPGRKDVAAAQTFWAAVLRERWVRFSRDGKFAPMGGFDARSELQSLLHEEPRIAAHFAPLLAPWTSGNPGAAAVESYWDVSSTEGLANFELGAIFERSEGEVRQVADVTYYSSSGYLAAVSLFEFIPLTGRATPQTLVWHGTLLSSAEVAGAFGLKRKFAIRTMEDEMRQWIGIFRRECAEEKK
jgi:hypothetical protein